MPFTVKQFSPEEAAQVRILNSFNYPELGEMVANLLGVEVCATEQKVFPNGELYFRSGENLRRKEVFIIASHVPGRIGINSAIQHSNMMIEGAKHASAGEITFVAPYLAYQRQDRKARGREAVGARMIRQAIEIAGAQRVVTIDAHSPAVESGFGIIFDHLTAFPELEGAVSTLLGSEGRDKLVIVSPDGGAVKTSQKRADNMRAGFVEISKRRDLATGEITRTKKIRGVKGAVCCIFDDMIDTAGTIVSAAETLKRSGAEQVFVSATHGIFSEPALDRLQSEAIDGIIVSDTFPMHEAKNALGDRLTVVSTAPILAKTIAAIYRGESVSALFNQQNYR